MIRQAIPHSCIKQSKPFWKNVMDKLKAIAEPVDYPVDKKEMEIVEITDRLTQTEFNEGISTLCKEFDIPQSLVTALILGNVANIVNKIECKDIRYNTLNDLTKSLREGDGNWMRFIPEYKTDSPIYLDRLDIGLIRAFYSFAISQGLDPIDAFNVTNVRGKEVQEFLNHASVETSRLAGTVSSVWYNYGDIYIYAARKVLGNPIKPSDIEIKCTKSKGLILS